MLGAGIGYKKRQYITHTTLPHHKTALQTFMPQQIMAIVALLVAIVAGFVLAVPWLKLWVIQLETACHMDLNGANSILLAKLFSHLLSFFWH